jgi:hypothetical protein
VRAITYDARLAGSALTNARIGALQSELPTRSAGYFMAKQPLLAASPVSDFTDWQFGAIAKVALDAASRVMYRFLKEGLRQTELGTIDPTEIASIESALLTELGSVLLSPENARGLQGHVSDVGASVNPAVLLPIVEVSVRVRPLGYPDDIRITLEYAGEV